MKELATDRWNELWRAAGAQKEAFTSYDQLIRRYAEPHRHYHNSQHIVECLGEFDRARSLARQPVAVELAIWFHDAIYDPRATDNEERSAEFARSSMVEHSLEMALCDSVVQLVLATKQHDASLHPDAPLIVDLDLSIFGQPAERFWEYERQIRKEYEWVPERVFSQKRAEILQQFLSRQRIYNTDYFHEQYEARARLNLGASIQKLGLQ